MISLISTLNYFFSCGVSFLENEKYLVYAYLSKGNASRKDVLRTDLCTRTSNLKKVKKEEIKKLKKLQKKHKQ